MTNMVLRVPMVASVAEQGGLVGLVGVGFVFLRGTFARKWGAIARKQGVFSNVSELSRRNRRPRRDNGGPNGATA